jgi:hypothetical protein
MMCTLVNKFDFDFDFDFDVPYLAALGDERRAWTHWTTLFIHKMQWDQGNEAHSLPQWVAHVLLSLTVENCINSKLERTVNSLSLLELEPVILAMPTNSPVPWKNNVWRTVAGHQKKDGVFFLCQATEWNSTLRPVSIKWSGLGGQRRSELEKQCLLTATISLDCDLDLVWGQEWFWSNLNFKRVSSVSVLSVWGVVLHKKDECVLSFTGESCRGLSPLSLRMYCFDRLSLDHVSSLICCNPCPLVTYEYFLKL